MLSAAAVGGSAAVLAHAGQDLAPHDLWGAWNLDPLIVVGLVAAAVAYARGRRLVGRHRRGPDHRPALFTGGLAVVALALVTPLDRLSGQLASAHMVQHLLLALIAPPLLVGAATGRTVLAGLPRELRRDGARWQRRLGLVPANLRWVRSAGAAWLGSVGALWAWHGSVPYQLALRHDLVHGVQHLSFLGTGLLFWSVIGQTHGAAAVGHGYRVLMLFTMATQSALLAALLTFARRPWYEAYDTTERWGLDALTDQQVAGAIMWVPAGLVYPLAAMAVLASWLRGIDRDHPSPAPVPPPALRA